ncbi:MAG: phosphate signaling complex protein PhoU [bacterium]
MRVHLQRDIDRLNQKIITLTAEVEHNIRAAVRAFEDRDEMLARQVVDGEARIDVLEVDLEEDCLKTLALHQPVASDLRYLVSVLKINRDLERCSDLAKHIAERALFLCGQPQIDIPFRIGEMAEKSQAMLRRAMDTFVNLDAQAAREVCIADGEIDAINLDNYELVKTAILKTPALFPQLLNILHVSRHLERIADHATNIAEDVIYLIEGRIARHSQDVSDKVPGPTHP